MRIYIIGNDGITLCREAPATVNEGEITLCSSRATKTARFSATSRARVQKPAARGEPFGSRQVCPSG